MHYQKILASAMSGTDRIARPPCLQVEDDVFRHDILSADVRRVHPDLPLQGTPQDRHDHIRRCDMLAYSNIRDHFPGFTPPSMKSDDPTVEGSRQAQVARHSVKPEATVASSEARSSEFPCARAADGPPSG